MELKEAKEKFINAWGTLGSNWGINRTMAQLHAYLLVSSEPLPAEEIMEALNISRGNTNMNLRMLIDWGLVVRTHKQGERKEFFKAEKDMWKVFTRIAKERRRRELEPIFNVLEEVSHVKTGKSDRETKEFLNTIEGIQNFAVKTDKMLERLIRADESWFLSSVMKLVK